MTAKLPADDPRDDGHPPSDAEESPARRIEYRPIDDLKPDSRNPKAHDVDTIDDSMTRFGYIEPVTVDDRTGLVVSGHGRVKTLRRMRDRGDAPPDGVITLADGTWLAPVTVGWHSTDDLEAAGALITLNRTTELGGWVDESLLSLLDELRGVDLTGVGFSDDEIAEMRARIEANFPPLSGDDSPRLDTLDPKPCPKCGYDTANDPDNLRKPR